MNHCGVLLRFEHSQVPEEYGTANDGSPSWRLAEGHFSFWITTRGHDKPSESRGTLRWANRTDALWCHGYFLGPWAGSVGPVDTWTHRYFLQRRRMEVTGPPVTHEQQNTWQGC